MSVLPGDDSRDRDATDASADDIARELPPLAVGTG